MKYITSEENLSRANLVVVASSLGTTSSPVCKDETNYSIGGNIDIIDKHIVCN